MTRRHLEVMLWVLTAVLALFTWRRIGQAVPGTPGVTPTVIPLVHGIPPRPAPTAVRTAALSVASRNPFRLDRSRAPVPFGALTTGVNPLEPSPPAPVQPALSLAGIVGPPWQALLEGLPGRQGAVVVRAGDRVEGLHIMSINREQVVVQNADTTWRLSLKRNWQ